MKRFSILMALILCVTIGGVFANWVYTEGTTASVQDNITFGMSPATSSTARGVFAIGDNNLTMHIDQKATKDYTAVLVVSGSVTFTFTPDANYDMSGFQATYQLSTVATNIFSYTYDGSVYDGEGSYTAKSVLKKFDSSAQLIDFTDSNSDGVYEATVTADMIKALIELNDFELNTYAEWEACSAALQAFPKIAVRIVDATVVA